MSTMPDQTGGGLAHSASQLVKELQAQQDQIARADKERSQVAGGKEAFHDALQAHEQARAAQSPAAVGAEQGVIGTQRENAGVTDILRQARAQGMAPSTRVGAAERVEESKLQRIWNTLVSGQNKMTKIMEMALSGRQFSPTEMLAMQVGVYRYSQELDLSSKVVQTLASNIKQTLNTQV